MKYKLKTKSYKVLLEALRRYTRFCSDESLSSAWTGLGRLSTYKHVYLCEHGLMRPVTPFDLGSLNDRRSDHWWKLTPAGEEIISFWLKRGYTHEHIEHEYVHDANLLPPSEFISEGECPKASDITKMSPQNYDNNGLSFSVTGVMLHLYKLVPFRL